MRRRAAGLLLAAVLPIAACSGSADGAADDGRPTVTVFAAASLTEVLEAVADAYDAAELELSFAGSQSLVAQVQQGAPADVVVTADESSARALGGQLDGEPVVVARNALAVVTERGNPLGLTTLADLARPGVGVVLGAPEVPVGRAARTALERAGVQVRPLSEEPDVKAVLGKVRLGEADAGVVYATDLAAAAGDVDGFVLDGVANAYLAGVVAGSAEPTAARDLVAWLRGDDGQALLARSGFLPP